VISSKILNEGYRQKLFSMTLKSIGKKIAKKYYSTPFGFFDRSFWTTKIESIV